MATMSSPSVLSDASSDEGNTMTLLEKYKEQREQQQLPVAAAATSRRSGVDPVAKPKQTSDVPIDEPTTTSISSLRGASHPQTQPGAVNVPGADAPSRELFTNPGDSDDSSSHDMAAAYETEEQDNFLVPHATIVPEGDDVSGPNNGQVSLEKQQVPKELVHAVPMSIKQRWHILVAVVLVVAVIVGLVVGLDRGDDNESEQKAAMVYPNGTLVVTYHASVWGYGLPDGQCSEYQPGPVHVECGENDFSDSKLNIIAVVGEVRCEPNERSAYKCPPSNNTNGAFQHGYILYSCTRNYETPQLISKTRISKTEGKNCTAHSVSNVDTNSDNSAVRRPSIVSYLQLSRLCFSKEKDQFDYRIVNPGESDCFDSQNVRTAEVQYPWQETSTEYNSELCFLKDRCRSKPKNATECNASVVTVKAQDGNHFYELTGEDYLSCQDFFLPGNDTTLETSRNETSFFLMQAFAQDYQEYFSIPNVLTSIANTDLPPWRPPPGHKPPPPIYEP